MIKGIVFDKDGTLFDFNATWGAWSKVMLTQEAQGDPERLSLLADVLGYDLENGVFRPGSIVIAHTTGEVADAMLEVLAKEDRDALLDRMGQAAKQVEQVVVTDLPVLFAKLDARGLALGLATNDSEDPARQHLANAGIADMFDFVAGSDSGFGGKPAPGQLHGFCRAVGLAATDCVMVGDSLHDLHAGRAAGMHTVGVLTGPALTDELAPMADVVLPSIADLPAWLDQFAT